MEGTEEQAHLLPVETDRLTAAVAVPVEIKLETHISEENQTYMVELEEMELVI